MALRLAAPDLRQLVDLAERTAPDQACALLIGRRGFGDAGVVTRIEVSPNRAADRKRRYEIDGGLRIGLERELRGQRLKVLGLWHAAPEVGPVPGEADTQVAYEPDLFLVITALVARQAVQTLAWRASTAGAFRPVPLLLDF